jgi:hypothetical protein
VAKKAERALQHELGDPSLNFLQFGYLAGNEGLLAGEKLSLDIKRMEMAYHDLNQREYELTKNISLMQVNPQALLQLRTTGRCTVSLPEALFDMDCPGHYFRRIRNVAISIPCITGPYTSVNCRLTLLKSSIRKSSQVGEGYARNLTDGEDDGRFDDHYGSLQSIVTSSSQNDSGLFEVNMNAERRLPFEGSGVISEWQLELPAGLPQFDYNTISDIVLHLRYTAREGGEMLKNAAVTQLQSAVAETLAAGSVRLFSIRNEFPAEWANLTDNPPTDDGLYELNLKLEKKHYPYWCQEKLDSVKRIDLYAKSAETSVVIYDGPDPNAAEVNSDALSIDHSLGGLLAGTLESISGPELPTEVLTLYFNSNAMDDLWISLVWGTDN